MFQGRENVYNTLVAKKSRKGSSQHFHIVKLSLEVSPSIPKSFLQTTTWGGKRFNVVEQKNVVT